MEKGITAGVIGCKKKHQQLQQPYTPYTPYTNIYKSFIKRGKVSIYVCVMRMFVTYFRAGKKTGVMGVSGVRSVRNYTPDCIIMALGLTRRVVGCKVVT